MDCGPTCIRIIAKYYGRNYPLQYLREKCCINREGVSLLGISEASEQIGFRTIAVKINYKQLLSEATLPCIVHWKQNHFIVVYKIKGNKVFVSDPAKGLMQYTKQEFLQGWQGTSKDDLGIVLLMEPTNRFNEEHEELSQSLNFKSISGYFLKYRKLFGQLMLGLLAGTILQLILPFLTQAVVDVGIATKDMQFIYLILAGQLMMFVGSTLVDFVRSWILLHISTRINLALLSDFLIKLMRLPLSYFDTKMIGDIMQRLGDHSRIESFLTGSTINIIFSIFNFVIFTFLMVAYDVNIFLIFLLGSIFYFSWGFLFLRARRNLDFKRFEISARNQSTTIQLVQGMQEIKMNNCETLKRWEWERIQAKLFKLNVRSLSINQLQQGGAFFINQSKNILITFLSAQAVVNGHLTLGGMLAVQYIIGQLNAPVQQFIQFIQSMQDAKISLERINEIHQMQDEEPVDKPLLTVLPENKSIVIKNLSYKYPGYDNEYVLKDINMYIPEGKTTAIVGMSGSGKTTLLKLLLKFYNPESGEIKVGEARLSNISHRHWRRNCGVVMQDGYIFSDTIANNIAVGEEHLNMKRLMHAVKVANIQEFIEALPLGYNTKIGAEGNGISQGQRQRILIARAVYKDPEFLFFDEATNALDANNEKAIMENMDEFFKGRTVVVVAHRLSTVKNADQIIVLDKGMITEIGSHEELTSAGGDYYKLVKNQLELGN
ncbi:peptidase domain-containing ABC transporter [Solitalea lacus]|uniref:peptidase domain-containing ABC transporter n=1 Tax=Solitalea lacus TaxID=2911172 RepID=UPI001EDC0C4A|nr:peptidase domain-containing ABC transporter [Solitalea lacus]UKJ07510.1 peptidase domain-containing ABC transporter [Solitalea lacus]